MIETNSTALSYSINNYLSLGNDTNDCGPYNCSIKRHNPHTLILNE